MKCVPITEAHGWSAIQIATPIIVGVGIITLAIAAFLIYRHRKYNHSSGGKRRQKPWESAHLHGPRRFFGLLPDRFTVRSRPTKEPQWEIDEQALQDTDLEPSPSSQGAASNNQSRPDMHSMHLRTTSTTSLISNMSHGTANRSRSIFSALTSKFNVFSPRDYSSGTTKGPDYKRVQVRSEHPDRRFKIDGGELTPRESAFSFPPPPPSPPPPERRDTLPSVLDIRRPSTAGGSRAGGQARNGSLPTTYYDDRTDLTSPIAPKSDYSLRTTDLQTPTSLSGSVPGAPFAYSTFSHIPVLASLSCQDFYFTDLP
ncbi:hypothetical protein PHLCEN_2v3853 [Hermanssonia centrifuga]|uniref:Uncharacterized protein n=1 Tax=Hermanssonia centrifuga TaxID=98765 RepID=A0A2R6QBC3_9APHY|nr:hypothetical protein PHLCEN_2v3853 [Hermanssonia centrifuga]